MNRRAKLLGGVSILLGAPSGASLSNLDLGKFSLDHLFNPRGGATTSVLDSDNYTSKTQELELKEETKQLQISRSKDVKELSLSELKSSTVDLSKQEKVSEQDQSTSISSIYAENIREGKTLALDRESREKTKQFQEKSSKWIENYNSARRKLGLTTSRRSRRSASPSNLSQLSKDERTALWEMLKLFEELEKESAQLFPKFRDIDDKIKITIASSTSRPARSVLETHLSQMDWMSRPQIKYENPQPKPRWGSSRIVNSTGYWTHWAVNPFRTFMEEKDYKPLIDNIKKSAQDKKVQSRLGALRRGSYWNTYYPTHEDKLREQKLANAKEELVHKVALQLLGWMGQAKKPLYP
ncbi:hypothetical protein [Candidatus Mycoplasma haematominutum]|uniref:Uncharacterized protein n=1 Tax=Candidatus Mycoplasma haematominutum 'Birmingham 1' TaxID=1116213 RepID=G8C3I9_9MOLU|nr:hypothetical protein [Candidatus Mycoplasma haematominutum]CCE66887.1 hypothetical protein MHM_03690 [Candidatus Mycoplasma haematominutum 'Birmingham 1']